MSNARANGMRGVEVTVVLRRQEQRHTYAAKVPRGAASPGNRVGGAGWAVCRVHRLCQHYCPLSLGTADIISTNASLYASQLQACVSLACMSISHRQSLLQSEACLRSASGAWHPLTHSIFRLCEMGSGGAHQANACTEA